MFREKTVQVISDDLQALNLAHTDPSLSENWTDTEYSFFTTWQKMFAFTTYEVKLLNNN